MALITVYVVGVLAVSLFVPVLLLRCSPTEPIAGRLDKSLVDLIAAHGMHPLAVFLWRTESPNAYLLGAWGPFRFLVLSIGLMRLPSLCLRGVVAHELGHLVNRHAIYFGLFAAALCGPLVKISIVGGWPFWIPSAFIWLHLVGYVSRSFERQADAHAMRILSRGVNRYSDAAAHLIKFAITRCGRDGLVGNWRHGSAAYRSAYLFGLVGSPVRRLSIDRLVVAIKIASLGLVALSAYLIIDAI